MVKRPTDEEGCSDPDPWETFSPVSKNRSLPIVSKNDLHEAKNSF